MGEDLAVVTTEEPEDPNVVTTEEPEVVTTEEPESELASTAPEPVVCTDHTSVARNCISTGCCIESSYTCFKRDDNYAECLSSCTHLAHAWSCAVHTEIENPAGPPAEEPEDPEAGTEDPEVVTTEDPDVVTTNSGSPGTQVSAGTGTPTGMACATPGACHGMLWVDGTKMKDQHGHIVQLRGVSQFWTQWSRFYTTGTMQWLAQDWKVDVVRCAMGADAERGGYLNDQAQATHLSKLEICVQTAIDSGIYVIIETFNEPLNTYSWSQEIKPYHEEINAVIRAKSSNIIIMGTRSWSQDVDEASMDPVDGFNLVYALHFYASSHGENNRQKARTAISNGLPLFASEWGVCKFSGGGQMEVNWSEVGEWLTLFTEHNISSTYWSVNDNEAEACSALKSSSSADGHWTQNDLSLSGVFIREYIQSNTVHFPEWWMHKIDELQS